MGNNSSAHNAAVREPTVLFVAERGLKLKMDRVKGHNAIKYDDFICSNLLIFLLFYSNQESTRRYQKIAPRALYVSIC